jgi:hypothetical protein
MNLILIDIPMIDDKEGVRRKFNLTHTFLAVGIFGRLSGQSVSYGAYT